VKTVKSPYSVEMIRSIDTTSVRSGIRRYKLDPWGVAVDEDSNTYVTDAASHNIDCPNLTLMGN